MTALALVLARPLVFQPVAFLLGFLLLVAILACVIIGFKYLMALADIAIPPPLLAMLGIIVFIVLLLALFNYSGLYAF